MRKFYNDSTIWISNKGGLGESYYLLCPVCGNSGIRVIKWEDGLEDEEDCSICKRMEELMVLAGYMSD